MNIVGAINRTERNALHGERQQDSRAIRLALADMQGYLVILSDAAPAGHAALASLALVRTRLKKVIVTDDAITRSGATVLLMRCACDLRLAANSLMNSGCVLPDIPETGTD